MPRRASLIVFLGLAVALVLVTSISAGAAPEDVREKRGEVASAQDRLMDIRMEVSAAEAAYNNALYEMNQLNGQIAQANEDLGGAKKRLVVAQADLEERASQVYKSGNVAFMDVLVGVDDFSEFATRLDLWVRLLGQERAKVEAVREAKQELAAKKRNFTEQREQRVAAVEKAIEQKDRAEAAEKEVEEYLASLNADLREAIQAEQARQAELAAKKYQKISEPAAAEPAPAPAPIPEVEVAQVEQIPVEQPDLQDEQAAAERAAAAEAAARRAERLAEKRAAERAAAREAAEQAAAEKRAAAREARQDAKAEAQRRAKLAAQRAAERQAAREAAEREAELAAQRAAAERAAAQQAADEREAARLAAQRRAELRAERQAAREAAQQAAAEQAAADQAAAEQATAEQAAAEQAAAEASASASAAAQEETNSRPSGETTGSASASASASAAPVGGGATGSGTSVIAEGQKYLGTPYVLGGTESCVPYEMMDCSCFTMTVYSAFGIALPDSPGGQMGYGTPVSGAPMAGDLLFWSEDGSGYITHVGIAMGDGTAIHASTFTGNVTQGTPIDAIPGYVGARRVL